ncbi:MAG: adenylate/guanylate cyclase domain-containing protein [Bdellovibrio sp.]
MKFFEKVIVFLFPEILLWRTEWEKIWYEQQRKEFVFGMRIFFIFVAFTYILHFYYVDSELHLEPISLWMKYRFAVAGISLLCFAFYCFPVLYNRKFYKVPTILACFVLCYLQARTVIWYREVPYLYAYLFVLISIMILRLNAFYSLIFGIGTTFSIFSTIVESGILKSMVLSATEFTLVSIIFLRSKYASDVKLFLANQRNLDAQKKIIKINLEFTNQIKAFLPKEIASRLTHFIQDRRMSVLQATDEVLRPKQQHICCLFSDIRGFTRESRDLSGFVSKALLPNVKATTEAVEKFSGIPRKIGDLIFAYFDNATEQRNILNALRSAAEISIINSEMNEQLPESMRVKRYLLLSAGEAIVGNISGFDSNIEITAIGSPVNFLSRLDEATKSPSLKNILIEGDIIISAEFATLLRSCLPEIELTLISIQSLGLKIRDFIEVDEIYLVPLTRKNYQQIFRANSAKEYTQEEAI